MAATAVSGCKCGREKASVWQAAVTPGPEMTSSRDGHRRLQQTGSFSIVSQSEPGTDKGSATAVSKLRGLLQDCQLFCCSCHCWLTSLRHQQPGWSEPTRSAPEKRRCIFTHVESTCCSVTRLALACSYVLCNVCRYGGGQSPDRPGRWRHGSWMRPSCSSLSRWGAWIWARPEAGHTRT